MSEPQSFGRYRVTGTLGAGAMGEVLAAVDELLGREVAVKTLRGRHTGLAARIADDRFRQEARAIAQLTHPSVVQVYDLDLNADPPYLVMERVAGPSLKERLDGGALPEAEVRALGIQIGNALATAHARGVVHRDVKPANILGAGPGVWKLADFGVAHVPDSSLTLTGQFVGSPAYAAPEALVRGQLGPEGDVFGLGATLYEAAAGTWPRASAEVKGLLAPVQPLRTLAPHVSPDLAAAIDRAVSVEPTARPSAAEFALALAAAPASAPGVAAVALPTPPTGMPMVTGFPTPPTGMPTASGGPATAPGAPMTPPGTWPVPSGPLATTPVASVVGWSAAGTSGSGSVPGWPVAGSAGAEASTPGAPTLGGTSPGAPAPAKAAASQRRKHAIMGIATLLVIALIAATRCSSSDPPSTVTKPGSAEPARPAASDDRPERPERPRRPPGSPIQVNYPQLTSTSREAAKDWNKVMDKLYRNEFGDARRKLAEWETKHGETDETRDLASQLDDLPEEVLRRDD